MGKNDLGDALGSGRSLRDLVRAADASDPLGAKAREGEIAELILKMLDTKIIPQVIASTSVAEAREIMEALMDPATLASLSVAARVMPAELERRWFQLKQGPRGIGGVITEIIRAFRGYSVNIIGGNALGALVQGIDPENKELSRLESPKGWTVDRSGIHKREGDTEVHIAHSPMVIHGRSSDIDTGAEMWRVAWLDVVDEKWISVDIERRAGLDGRMLIELSQQGAPVGAHNALEMVRFLADFEASNRHKLPVDKVTSHLGWQKDDSFLPGHSSLRLAISGNDRSLLQGWGKEAGSYAGWCEAVKKYVVHHPLALLAIYSACAAPLLHVLDEPGFVVDWSGETSTGKTTALLVAGSVWGNPKENVHNWDAASDVAPVAYAATLSHLPVLLDDTQGMSSQKQRDGVAALLYAIPSGQERARAGIDGKGKARRRFRTCLLSTGEVPITSFSNAAGARARTICFRGSPFEGAEGLAVERLKSTIRRHYGHLGPRFIQAVKDHADIIGRFDEIRDEYVIRANSNVAKRMSGYLAVLHLAAEIVHDHCDVPGDSAAALVELQRVIGLAVRDADRPADALREVWSWALSAREFFSDTPPSGRESFGCFLHDRELGIRPSSLREQLVRLQFDPDVVINAWADRGWLIRDPDMPTARRRLRGHRTRLVVINLTSGAVRKTLDLAGTVSAQEEEDDGE